MKISVPIRRINILEKTDSIPRIESFFRLFFQSGRNFSDLPSIFFYIHISCHRDFSSNRIIRHVTMGERRMLFTSRLDGKRNRGTRVGSEISRSQMKRVLSDHAVRFESPLPSARTDLYYPPSSNYRRTTLSFTCFVTIGKTLWESVSTFPNGCNVANISPKVCALLEIVEYNSRYCE